MTTTPLIAVVRGAPRVGAMSLVALSVSVALVVAVLAAAKWWLRSRPPREVRHFALHPEGARVEDLAQATQKTHTALAQLGGPSALVAVHRYVESGVVRVAVSVAGCRKPDAFAAQLARAVGCRAVSLATPPALDAPALARSRRGELLGVARPDGVLDGVAQHLGAELASAGEGSFVTVSARPVGRREHAALRRFIRASLGGDSARRGLEAGGVHPWEEATRVVAAVVVAGATSADGADALLGFAPRLPRSDHEVVPGAVDDAAFGLPLVALALVVVGAGLLTHHGAVGWFAAGGATLAGGLLVATGRFRIAERALRRQLAAGVVRPRRASALMSLDTSARRRPPPGSRAPARRPTARHPFALAREVVLLTAEQFAAVVARTGELDVRAAETHAITLPAPAAVRAARGARLGYDPEGVAIEVPPADRTGGIAILGDPNMGKTTIVGNVFASDAHLRLQAVGEGARRVMVYFDTKGEGAGRFAEALQRVGYADDEYLVLNVTDEASRWRLELFDRSSPERSARAFVGGMRYTFEQGDIHERSNDLLSSAFWIVSALPAPALEGLGQPAKANLMELCFGLLGGDERLGERIAKVVLAGLGATTRAPTGDWLADFTEGADRVAATMERHPVAEASRAWRAATAMGRSDLQSALAAARNKVAKLRVARALWEPSTSRTDVTFRDVIERNGVVLLDLGDARTTTEELRSLLARISLKLLWDVIQDLCHDWFERGWSVALYADELAHLASPDAAGRLNVIAQTRDAGRSRGLWPVYASQRMDQLSSDVRSALSSFETKVYLRMENAGEAAAAAADLTGLGEGGYGLDDLRSLRRFTGACRMHVRGVPQPPFTLEVAPITDLDAAVLASRSRTSPKLSGPGAR